MFNKRRQNISLVLFLLPALAVYVIFKLYPAIAGIFYSLTNWNGLNKDFDIIGFANFKELLSDKYFWDSLWFTCKYVIALLIIANVLAIIFSSLVEAIKKGKGFFRTIFCLPNMISMVIGGYMWKFVFYEALYYMADNWGWSFLDVSWAGDVKYSYISLVIVAVWGCLGYLMIIYMAALQGVPKDMLEAASIDGANAWQKFFHISLPLIRPAITICLFWTLNNGFQVFDVIYSLTGGGPGRATQSVAINIYEEAFAGNIRYGYATAKSTVLFLIIVMITSLQMKMTQRKEEEL